MTTPVRITITGAAGNIGYALAFRIASGNMLGPHTPVQLRLLEIPQAVRAAEGTAMELLDAAFPLLRGIEVTDSAETAFDGANVALLVGAMPRKAGMDRGDLLAANGEIFSAQGRAMAAAAANDIRALVVGNPANTNAAILRAAAADIPAERFHALMRLDHNRAVAQLAQRAGVGAGKVTRVHVWGNHSNTQVPDVEHGLIGERSVREVVADDAWLDGEFATTVARRGAAIIEARGASSAASAASATIDHMRDWTLGTREGDWVTIARPSLGEYGFPLGCIAGVPAIARDGEWQVVEGLEISPEMRTRIDASIAELEGELAQARELGILN